MLRGWGLIDGGMLFWGKGRDKVGRRRSGQGEESSMAGMSRHVECLCWILFPDIK